MQKIFLDQIVLSIVFDKVLNENNQHFGYLGYEIVCDIDHNQTSTLWQLATNKTINENYENYKNQLDEIFNV